jgi:glycosyltransferase involved in cell wall biosynthesis
MKEKKILFVIKGGSEWMGGLHYIKNLIKTVKYFNSLYTIDLLVYTRSQAALFADVKPDISEIHIYDEAIATTNLIKRLQWWSKRKTGHIFHPGLDEFIRKHGYQFAYPCLPRKDFTYYRFAEWIPDFQYRHFPDGSNPTEIAGRKEQNTFVTKNAPLIYVSSYHALRDCEELFPLSKGKIEVMQFCVFSDPVQFPDTLEKIRNVYSIPAKYFMVSNLLAPTKNLEVVIRAAGILKKRGISMPVVVSGDIHDYRNPDFKHGIFQLISRENVREEIIMLGLLPRIVQKQLLVNALAILQPSRFEGWNTLVEEAKWLGKEIILSDIPVHLEQAPSLATYFKDNDAEDLAVKLETSFNSAVTKPEKNEIAVSPAYTENIAGFAKHFIGKSFG